MIMSYPGIVVRVYGKDKSRIDVQFKDKVVTARNLIKDIKIGDYVILKDDLVIQRLSEREVEKLV